MTALAPLAARPVARGATVRPRLVRAGASVAVAAATGAGTVATAEHDPARARAVASWLVVAGVVVLVVGLATRRVWAVGLAMVGFGVAYGVGHVHARTGLPGWALVMGPALLASAELALWSIDLAPAAADERGALRDRAAWILLVVVGSGLAGLTLAAAARVRLAGDLPLDALSVAAALGLLALVVALAQRGSMRR